MIRGFRRVPPLRGPFLIWDDALGILSQPPLPDTLAIHEAVREKTAQ